MRAAIFTFHRDGSYAFRARYLGCQERDDTCDDGIRLETFHVVVQVTTKKKRVEEVEERR